MKKVKEYFVPNHFSKYSDIFFKRILLRSSVATILLSSILLSFFMWKTIDNRFQEEQNTLIAANEDCNSTMTEVLSNAKNISMFFALYKDFSPLYQAESKMDVRKIMLEQEMIAFVSCFNYLTGVRVETRDTTATFGMNTNVKYEEVAFFDPFVLSASDIDSYPRLLKLSYTAPNLDTFSVDITIDSEYLSTHYMPENAYLLNKDGTILLAHDYNLINQPISDVLSVDMDKLCKNAFSSKYLCAGTPFSEDGLMLISVTPKSDVYTSTVGQLLSVFLIFVIIMIVVVFLLALILGHLYQPIKNVAQILKYHMPNNDSMLESDADFIKNCMKRYSTSDDVDAALLQIRKSQLQTLQAQISPHTLGNTLESIKWDLIAVVGNESKLVTSIGSLSMFLEESYEYQRMITSIGAEVERTKYYADMMVYCFYERLQVEWIVSEDVLDCAIINLTLQPFIENCINHGFTRLEDNPLITVRIAESDDNGTLFVEIEDNGKGMDANTLANIMQTLRDDGPCEHHIGIKNSHLKLKLLFGDEYGVTDIQSDGNGTYVKLTLPKIEAPKGIST